jgi:hypothetical protein
MKIDPQSVPNWQGLSPIRLAFWPGHCWHTPPIHMAGGIPGQPDPDTPNEQPTEPGEPTLPDEPPPAQWPEPPAQKNEWSVS